MKLSALNCPNCGAGYNPANGRCEYCGSYIIISKGKYVDLSNIKFDLTNKVNDNYPGIYVFGRLLGRGEKPITLGMANYFTGIISAGGKILLTNKSLSFSAHMVNVGRKETKIELSDITDVRVGVDFLISQQIIVSTQQEKHKFVVYHAREWVEKIKEAVAHVGEYSEEMTLAEVDYTMELRKLKKLCEDGIITQEEFEIKKRMILGL